MMENEKTTALIPSVGADGGQPPHNSTYQSIPHETCESNPPEENIEEMRERIRRMNDPHYLHTVSMTELYQTAYKSRPPVIDGLLYSGAYILAGAPKIGKSFLVAQLAYHVSTGQRLWGYEVHQGTVLYLALEDDFQRIQSRMFMMYGVADTASLHFATAANKIGNGLDEQLENFIKEHPDTKLVIIDTMQKIRETGGEAYSYASDYEIIGKLKRFADRHSICIVTVHHTRKQPAGDSFETISGTTGLLGCADGALLMQKKKRTALEATVDAVGRDQQDQILYLKKDADTQIWSLERTENEPYQEPPDPVLDTVSQLVSSESREWTGSPTELAGTVNTSYEIGLILNRAGSVIIELVLIKTKFLRFSENYSLYAEASKKTPMLNTISREYALSRTSIVEFLVLAIWSTCIGKWLLSVCYLAVAIVFLFSCKKHSAKIATVVEMFRKTHKSTQQ